MAWLIEYLIFIMQLLHKYEILPLQITALENLIEAFRIIIKLSKHKPQIFLHCSFTAEALSTINLKQQNQQNNKYLCGPPPYPTRPTVQNTNLFGYCFSCSLFIL